MDSINRRSAFGGVLKAREQEIGVRRNGGSVMTRKIAGRVSAVMIALFAVALNVSAVTVTSTDFSIGYGINDLPQPTGGSPNWNTLETVTANTDVTGDFTFTPTVVGPEMSGSGPIFGPPLAGATPRVLADGGGRPGWGDFYGNANGFGLTLAGSYTGTLPAGAVNVQTTIEIDSVSIYGFYFRVVWPPVTNPPNLAWEETTPGNAATSPAIDVPGSFSPTTAADWDQLVWDPGDEAQSGTSATRTFALVSSEIPAGWGPAIDGLEFTGRIVTTYEINAVTSTDFSIGYGWSELPNVEGSQVPTWSTTETAAANTNVMGDFTLTPAFLPQGNFSTDGPIFGPPPTGAGTSPAATPRVLANGSQDDYPGGPREGMPDFLANANGFGLTLSGSYTGTLPAGAADIETTLEIDSISVHGFYFRVVWPPVTNPPDLGWEETTPGNAATSARVDVPGSFSLKTAADFSYLTWGPGEAPQSGLTATRTFVLVSSEIPAGWGPGVDGLEFTGRIVTTFSVTAGTLVVIE